MKPAPHFDTLRYSMDGAVATVLLDRPDARNAFNAQMMRDLLALFDHVDGDDAVRAVIVSGAGQAFCAGADLKEGFGVGGGEGAAFRDRGGQIALRILASTKPVIGVLNGAAAGAGATMLLAMDMRIACPEGRFLFPYTKLGLVPEGCASWFLPRLVGMARALEWTLWGEAVDAGQALEAGLVSAIHPREAAMAMAVSRGRALAETTSPVSVALTRRMLWDGLATRTPQEAHLEESRLVQARRAGADAQEGIAAFRDKRAPVFPQTVSADLPALLTPACA